MVRFVIFIVIHSVKDYSNLKKGDIVWTKLILPSIASLLHFP